MPQSMDIIMAHTPCHLGEKLRRVTLKAMR